MPFGLQRILAVLTAAAVLLMSIDCACAGGMSSTWPSDGTPVAAGAGQMACCAHHAGMAHHCSHEHDGAKRHQPNPCKGQCEHCGQTVMNDSVAPPSLGLSLLSHAFSIVLSIDVSPQLGTVDSTFRSSAPIAADLPPPLTSPTLLSQHCALTN